MSKCSSILYLLCRFIKQYFIITGHCCSTCQNIRRTYFSLCRHFEKLSFWNKCRLWLSISALRSVMDCLKKWNRILKHNCGLSYFKILVFPLERIYPLSFFIPPPSQPIWGCIVHSPPPSLLDNLSVYHISPSIYSNWKRNWSWPIIIILFEIWTSQYGNNRRKEVGGGDS